MTDDATASPSARSASPTPGWPRVVAIIGGVFFLLTGLGALAVPRAFFDAVATFEPYNPHFLQDIGAFQIGLGAVLLLATLHTDALVVALTGVGVGSAAHLVSHVVGLDLGGNPATDLPLFAVLTLALLAGGLSRWTSVRRR